MKTLDAKYAHLFQAVEQLDFPVPTMLEVGGYPHYENVTSNYLAYFLDPAQPHGMEDVLLRAL